jgi:hypothetical protein
MQIRSVDIDLGKTTFHLVTRKGANRRDPTLSKLLVPSAFLSAYNPLSR